MFPPQQPGSRWLRDERERAFSTLTTIDLARTMRRMTRVLVALCLCIFSLGAAHATEANALRPNTLPLAFGMSVEETATALGAPLTLIAVQRRGGEVYFSQYDARVPGFPVEERIVLQFRKGHLTGWKQNWRINKPWFL
jgi:hypothetical protein